ncbi:MAG: DNA repair protein RecO [candidate division NC10 bacterium]|nr:DNA repair protein RecO [candidate division NC10 bacterium]
MPLYRTEAIVMGGWDLGETDRIISFYTRRRGTIRAVAAGARRTRSRFGGRLQLFTHGHLLYFGRENRELFRINEFEPIDSFPALRSDLDRLSHASYLVELTSLLVWVGEVSEEIFSLLLASLRRLEANLDSYHVERAFEARLLRSTGYLPELSRCLKCQRTLRGVEEVFFSPQEGGVLCSDCSPAREFSLPLSPASLSYLLEAERGDFHSLSAASLSAREREQIGQAMRAHLSCILQRRMHTLDFMEQLERASPERRSDCPPPGQGREESPGAQSKDRP